MRSLRRRMIMANIQSNKMYELLGKALRFHPSIDDSYGKLISSWDVSKVTSLYACFQSCNQLTSLDLSSWDVSKVTNMSYAFYGCSYLRNINFGSNNFKNVTTLAHAFSSCDSLTLDLSDFDFSNLQSLEYTFNGDLKEIKLPELGENNVLTNLYCTWYNCRGITKLDLSKFNTRKVTNYGWVFEGATGLEWLDISGFDLSSATSVPSMFRNPKLTHLKLGEGFGKALGSPSIDMSSFASLDAESRESFMSLYDRKANGLSNMTLTLKSSYGFTDEQIQTLTNKGYTINLK